jgi:hypothetical protein
MQELEQVQAEQVSTKNALEFAEMIAKSDIIPDEYKGKPANILVAAEYGKPYGLSIIQSLQAVDVINGKPRFTSRFKLGVMRQHGYDLVFEVSGTTQRDKSGDIIGGDLSVTLTDKKSGNSVTKTIVEIAHMGLVGRDQWKKQPETMLKWRVVTEFANFYAPELFLTGAYTPDDLLDIPAETEPITAIVVDVEDVETPQENTADTEADDDEKEEK